jgi:hypothetical protein
MQNSPHNLKLDLSRIVVRSRVKAWWLIVMKGYAVDTVRRRPKLSRLGSIEYDVEWHLLAPDEDEAG